MASITYSVIVPVYKNEESIPRLVEAMADLSRALDGRMEAVFVVDGSPDRSFELLRDRLGTMPFPVQLLAHSRNFGSFPAIRSGLMAARGDYFGVMAADLQEPPELLLEFFKALEADTCDVAIGTRTGRNDPLVSQIASRLFWTMYRKLIVRDMPEGGVDVFGCNRVFRDQLVRLEESRSSLVALIFWLGYRRTIIPYARRQRLEGKSGWTWRKKMDYMMDSIFAFTDYPIRLLIRLGAFGSVLSLLIGFVVFVAHVAGQITVPGYTAIILAILFFGAINVFSLGLVGNYAWRAYENTKKRPLAVVAVRMSNTADASRVREEPKNQ